MIYLICIKYTNDLSIFFNFRYYYYGSDKVKNDFCDKEVQITLKNGKKIKGIYQNCIENSNQVLIDNIFVKKEEIQNIRELDDIEKYILIYNSYIEYERRLTKNTVVSYNNDLEKYHDFLIKKNIYTIESITKGIISDYLKELVDEEKITTTSLARKLTTIKNFHSFLFQHEYISKDVSTSIERPKLRKALPKVLTVEEVDKLLDINLNTVFDYRDKAMLELMYATGLRISELLNLTLNDIDLENCIVRCMGKGKKERMIPIGEYVLESMNNYLERRTKLYNMKKMNIYF